ncbi:ATP-binding protein [Alteromonas sp. BMJM2]|uniref:ATP-binding protein n=1 Tax=Alteromonas sp. BMJM2 TaxID=2954241 RepID=UPI0022B304FD|nr:AAA family ATPase [Alteromonas sp. BMJM2]
MFKLDKLKIKNFKVFKEFELNFTSSHLSLLDGPNGFGKTSFYDALELLFLGKVQRYIDIENKTHYGKKQKKKYPLLNNQAESFDDLLVELSVTTEKGDKVVLKRGASCSSLWELKSISEATFDFKVLKNGEPINFENESEILTKLLGKNYKRNYGLFHYIEQEENTALLKTKATDKQQKIDHLFDVSEYRAKIEKIEQIRKSIQPLQTPTIKTNLRQMEQEIIDLEKSSTPADVKQTKFFKLLEVSEQPWDREEIVFTPGNFSNWVGENGDLLKIKNLIRIEPELRAIEYNRKLQQELFYKGKAPSIMLRYGMFLDDIPQFKKHNSIFEQAKEVVAQMEKGAVFVIKNRIVPSNTLNQLLSKPVDTEEMLNKSAEINDSFLVSNKANERLSSLLNNREQLKNAYKAHFENLNETPHECPMCGHDWMTAEALFQSFDEQKAALDSLLDANGKLIQSAINDFEKSYMRVIKEQTLEIIKNYEDSIEFKQAICKLSESQVKQLKSLKEVYNSKGILLDDLYAKSFSLAEPLKIEELENRVLLSFKPVSEDLILPELEDTFNVILKNQLEQLKLLTEEKIDDKIAYINYKFNESKTKEVRRRRQELMERKEQFKKASDYYSKLGDLVKVYKENVSEYITSISKSIEILFHIYTGRLLQNFQNGLGIFIESDGKSVSFTEDPDSNHDVIYSMSSGQLSSLAIAFTIALNHKYAKNKLLLIDDPVQTMDEINVAGFIDLLRHQFKDRQILISTHEDHTSSYFRYKFSKAGLSQERINFNAITKAALEKGF